MAEQQAVKMVFSYKRGNIVNTILVDHQRATGTQRTEHFIFQFESQNISSVIG
jgi:hypothetical protein